MTTAVLSYLKIQKKVKLDTEVLSLVNWKFVCITCFLLSSCLLIFYVLQINSLTRNFYLIDNYERQTKILTQEKKELEISFAESSFWGQAIEKISMLNFHKANSVKYIKVSGNSVAATLGNVAD